MNKDKVFLLNDSLRKECQDGFLAEGDVRESVPSQTCLGAGVIRNPCKALCRWVQFTPLEICVGY